MQSTCVTELCGELRIYADDWPLGADSARTQTAPRPTPQPLQLGPQLQAGRCDGSRELRRRSVCRPDAAPQATPRALGTGGRGGVTSRGSRYGAAQGSAD